MVSPSHQPECCRTYPHSRIRTCLLNATPTPTSAELYTMRPRGRCLPALIARVCSLSSHTTLLLAGSCVCCLMPPMVEVCPSLSRAAPAGALPLLLSRAISPSSQDCCSCFCPRRMPPHKSSHVCRSCCPQGTPPTLVALVLPERGSSLLSSVLSLLLSPQAAVLSQGLWCCPIPSVLCRSCCPQRPPASSLFSLTVQPQRNGLAIIRSPWNWQLAWLERKQGSVRAAGKAWRHV